MLTLAETLRLGTFTVFRDVTYPGGTRTLTSTFYALPDLPRLANDDDGGPAFRFWWYRRPLPTAGIAVGGGAAASAAPLPRAGGVLQLTVALGPSADERVKLLQDLASHFQLDPATVQLLPLPFVSGSVALSFAGEGSSGGDLSQQVAGNGPALLTGNEQASFLIDLTADGAALLADALDKKLDVLRVAYDLVFEYHLDGVRLRVWCDAGQARLQAQGLLAQGPLDAQELLAALAAARVAGVEISSDAPIPDDQLAALRAQGQQILTDALAQAVVAPDGKGVQPVDPQQASTLNHTFTMSYPALQHAAPSALLQLPLDDATRPTRVQVIDLATEAQPLDLTILCPIDFTQGLVSAVRCSITYGGTGFDGRPFQRANDFLFKQGNTRATFHSMAANETRAFGWSAEVFYQGGKSLVLPEAQSDERTLVLALEGLGVLDVACSLNDVPLDLVTSVVVDLDYPPAQLQQQLILDGTHTSDRWQAVVGTVKPGALRSRATFITNDGRRVTGDWQSGGGTRLAIDAPRGLADRGNVQVVASGDFEGVAQLLVELRCPGNDTATLHFTQAGQVQSFSPRLPPGAPLAYQSRTTVLNSDGTQRVSDWIDRDSTLLVVSDQARFTVQVVGKLLDLGGALSAAVVAWAPVDPQPGESTGDALVLRDRNTGAQFSLLVGPAGQHRYKYQLTLVPKGGGERAVLPWLESEEAVLVLRPPVV